MFCYISYISFFFSVNHSASLYTRKSFLENYFIWHYTDSIYKKKMSINSFQHKIWLQFCSFDLVLLLSNIQKNIWNAFSIKCLLLTHRVFSHDRCSGLVKNKSLASIEFLRIGGRLVNKKKNNPKIRKFDNNISFFFYFKIYIILFMTDTITYFSGRITTFYSF